MNVGKIKKNRIIVKKIMKIELNVNRAAGARGTRENKENFVPEGNPRAKKKEATKKNKKNASSS